MTEERVKLLCLDEKRIEAKIIYNNRQWLERFKPNTKRKYEIDIGSLIKEETMTGTDWNSKEEKIKQDFLWAQRLEATHQIPRSEYRTDPENIKIDKLFKLYNRHYLPQKKRKTIHEEIFLGKTNRYRNTGRPLEEITKIRKRMRFSGIQRRITYIKLTTSTTDRKLRDKLMKKNFIFQK